MSFTDLNHDVLVELVEAYVQLDHTDPYAAIHISHINHALRQAALGTSSIWNGITIHSSRTSSLELAYLFAERAGSRPQIEMGVTVEPPINTDDLETIFNFIEAHAPVLKELYIEINSYSPVVHHEINAMLDKIDAVHLRTLSVGHSRTGRDYFSPDLRLRFAPLPSMRHLIAWGLALDSNNASYDGLTSLTLGSVGVDSINVVVQQAQQLQHISLTQMCTPNEIIVVTLAPKLKSLRIEMCPYYIVACILHILNAPVLEMVEISIMDSYTDFETPVNTYPLVTSCRMEDARCGEGADQHPSRDRAVYTFTHLMSLFPATQSLHVPFDLLPIILDNPNIAENITDLCFVRPVANPCDFDHRTAFICLTEYIRIRRDTGRPLHSIKFMGNSLEVDYCTHWRWELLRASLNWRLPLVDHDDGDA